MSAGHELARFIRRWHARLGVVAALFFAVLVGTGIALNHTDALRLAHIPVTSAWLARWLGLPAPAVLSVVETGVPLIATREAWLYGAQRLPDGGGAIRGAVRTSSLLAVATAERLVVYTPEGARIDTLRGDALPALPLVALGRHGDALVVRTPRGSFASDDALSWRPIRDASVHWSRAAPPTDAQRAQTAERLAPALPLERLVLDLHAGRLYGRHGPWLVDAAALVLLLLAGSGLWIQWRSWRRPRRDGRRDRPHHARHRSIS